MRKTELFLKRFFSLNSNLGCITANGSADLRSPENEVCFRSWDFAHHQIYKSILNTQKLIKKP